VKVATVSVVCKLDLNLAVDNFRADWGKGLYAVHYPRNGILSFIFPQPKEGGVSGR